MQRKKMFVMPVIAGILIVIASGIALALTQSAHAAQCGAHVSSVLAQCGSQVSSCKNCHEVQEKKPVNNDGTPWHTSHAFGDFCYICHGGNQQATDETAAHIGLGSPLSDIQSSCAQCTQMICRPAHKFTRPNWAFRLGPAPLLGQVMERLPRLQLHPLRQLQQYFGNTSTRRDTTIRVVSQ